MDEQQQKIRRRQDVVEAVPLQFRQEDVDVECIAYIVQESGEQLEGANVELKVPSVLPHHHQRWHERNVRENLKAECDERLCPSRVGPQCADML